MGAKDDILRIRVDKKTTDALMDIAERIQKKTPEGVVNVSTVARYALEKYIKEFCQDVNKAKDVVRDEAI